MERLVRVMGHLEPRARPFEVVERDDAFVLLLDVPGCSRRDVSVTVEEAAAAGAGARSRLLTVVAERKAAEPGSRRHGKASYSLRLPATVDDEGVVARVVDGVLFLTLPKVRPEPGRSVSVE